MHRALTAVAVLGLLAACSRPPVPEKDKPVDPQAARAARLERAMHAPVAQARASQAAVEAAARAQDAAIDAATQGDTDH